MHNQRVVLAYPESEVLYFSTKRLLFNATAY